MKDFDVKYKLNKNLFWEEPLNIIKISEKFLRKNEKIIDLGCWQWRNLLYLLSNWYNIYWIDSSNIAINNLKKGFKKNKKRFIFWDVKYIERFYGFNILSSFLFHFIKNQKEFIKKCQKMTKKWWIHIISDFLEKENNKKWFINSEELKELYKDWEFLYYEEDEINTLLWEKWPFYSLIAKKKYE